MKRRPRGSDDATLDAYLREISRFPPLTGDEEHDLGCRIRRHRDQRAFKRLVEANLRFVVSYAERYRGMGVLFLDLIDEGNLGLMEAARRFDPERNGQFTTYAAWWVRQAIIHALADQGRAFAATDGASAVPVCPPAKGSSVSRADAAARREMAELFDDTDFLPEPSAMGRVTPKREACAIAGDDGLAFGDALRAEVDAVVVEAPVRSAVVAAVREVLHELGPREREVVSLRFGLEGEPMTVEQIGRRLRVPRERVRQIEIRARAKMRRSHKARELRSTLN
ncbi:MAG: RNA polymerase sigma factor RpoD/SigA [Bacteroidales bacterium]